MAALIPAENIVAAVIIFGDGVVSAHLERGVQGLEAWQQSQDRHFGTWRHDVRSSLTVLWFDDEEVRARCATPETVLHDLTLAEAGPILLKYRSFYANDESAYWTDRSTPDGSDSPRELGASLLKSSGARERMRRFFGMAEDPSPDDVLGCLRELGLDQGPSCVGRGQGAVAEHSASGTMSGPFRRDSRSTDLSSILST